MKVEERRTKLSRFHSIDERLKAMSIFQTRFFNYKKDHETTLNFLLHVVFVPLTGVSLLKCFGLVSKEHFDLGDFNVGWVVIAALTPFFMQIDSLVGLFTSAYLIIADYFLMSFDFGLILNNFQGFSQLYAWIVIHAISWIALIAGHSHEGRETGLLEDTVLSFGAPVFVFVELWYYFIGYRREEIAEVMDLVLEDVMLYREERKNKLKER